MLFDSLPRDTVSRLLLLAVCDVPCVILRRRYSRHDAKGFVKLLFRDNQRIPCHRAVFKAASRFHDDMHAPANPKISGREIVNFSGTAETHADDFTRIFRDHAAGCRCLPLLFRGRDGIGSVIPNESRRPGFLRKNFRVFCALFSAFFVLFQNIFSACGICALPVFFREDRVIRFIPVSDRRTVLSAVFRPIVIRKNFILFGDIILSGNLILFGDFIFDGGLIFGENFVLFGLAGFVLRRKHLRMRKLAGGNLHIGPILAHGKSGDDNFIRCTVLRTVFLPIPAFFIRFRRGIKAYRCLGQNPVRRHSTVRVVDGLAEF